MKKINKKISSYNFTAYKNRTIKYIVIHWVGAVSTAKDNAYYFYGGNRKASAHYFVDTTSIWQSVLDKNAAWAVGGGPLDQASPYAKYGKKYFGKCLNANSISIEMCCAKDKNGKLYIPEKTIKNTGELVRYLMEEHDIPASNVIRHFDVNGKICPGTHIETSDWKALHKTLTTEKKLTKKATKKAARKTFIKAVQKACGAKQDGIAGTETLSKTVTVSAKKNRTHKVVRVIQTYLNALGYDCGEVDGIAGALFTKAVKAFQKDHGCIVDGELTAQAMTWKKLLGLA